MIDSNFLPWVTAFSCTSLIFVALAIILFHLDTIDTTFYILLLSLFLSLLFLHRLSLPLSFTLLFCSFSFLLSFAVFSLFFQAPVVPILLILRTSHLPGQLYVANLFQDLMAAIYLIRSMLQIGLPRLLQQQPVVTNLAFPSLLSYL